MTHQEIELNYIVVEELFEKKRLVEGLADLENEVQALGDWNYSQKLDELRSTYRMMLSYLPQVSTDPMQDKIYSGLFTSAFRLLEEVTEDLYTRNSHNFVFSQKRFLPHQVMESGVELLTKIETAEADKDISALLEQNLNITGKDKEYAQISEIAANDLFKKFWLTAEYTSDDVSLYERIMKSEHVQIKDKCLMVSALMMSLLRAFSEPKALLFINQYTAATDEAISQRVMVGLLPILAKYNSRLIYFPAIRNRLVVLADEPRFSELLLKVVMQYVRTNETERITKKMQEEILPEMMRVAPKIKDKLDLENMTKNDDPDERNPEWQQMLEESGIADKLKEFSELQMEGSDVYMSTFAMLKNFPFFNDVPNWFRLFDARQSDISDMLINKNQALLPSMISNGLMCNSDKYSFCLSLAQMPEQQRSMMSKAFEAETDQIKEMQAGDDVLKASRKAEMESNFYIQDIYRFFRLFRHKEDFYSPFKESLNFHSSWFFELMAYSTDDVKQLAEYYFSKDFFKQALELFIVLENKLEKTADLYQKMGYCFQRRYEYSEAIRCYEQADMISPNHKWTLRKLAYCYRLINKHKEALANYLKLEEILPENLNIQIQIGNAYLALKQYDSALAYFFRVEYATENNSKVWRAIGWTSFLAGKSEQAEKYYQQAVELNAEWMDHMNLGHVNWAAGNKKQAITQYQTSLQLLDNDMKAFVKNYTEDLSALKEKGITDADISMLFDYLRIFKAE